MAYSTDLIYAISFAKDGTSLDTLFIEIWECGETPGGGFAAGMDCCPTKSWLDRVEGAYLMLVTYHMPPRSMRPAICQPKQNYHGETFLGSRRPYRQTKEVFTSDYQVEDQLFTLVVSV